MAKRKRKSRTSPFKRKRLREQLGKHVGQLQVRFVFTSEDKPAPPKLYEAKSYVKKIKKPEVLAIPPVVGPRTTIPALRDTRGICANRSSRRHFIIKTGHGGINGVTKYKERSTKTCK